MEERIWSAICDETFLGLMGWNFIRIRSSEGIDVIATSIYYIFHILATVSDSQHVSAAQDIAN
jgi:hypothetical protein